MSNSPVSGAQNAQQQQQAREAAQRAAAEHSRAEAQKKLEAQVRHDVQALGGTQKAQHAIKQEQKANGSKPAATLHDINSGKYDAKPATKLLGEVKALYDLNHADHGHKEPTGKQLSSTLNKVMGPTDKQLQAQAKANAAKAAKAGAKDGWEASNTVAAVGSQGPAQTYQGDANSQVDTSGQASTEGANAGGQTTANAGSTQLSGAAGGSGSLYSLGPAYAAQKAKILAILKEMGVKSPQLEEIMAIAMMETPGMKNSQHDASKDGDPHSRNFGLFNMNADLLAKYCGVPVSQQAALNDDSNLAGNLKAIVTGMKNAGADDFVTMLRGGTLDAAKNPSTLQYKDAMKTTMAAMTKPGATLLTDGQRLGLDVTHI